MNKDVRYSLVSFGILLLTTLVLIFLVHFDGKEYTFYSSGGIVYFAQYLVLSAGILALGFVVAGTWHTWMMAVGSRTWILTILVHFPLTLLAVLLTYTGLLFLAFT
jgi:hypothetical protein